MLGTITIAESVEPNRRYWLDPDGTAFLVSDHLMAAQYAKAESSEFDKRGPWGYEDMWRNGWVRVHTERDVIWADNGMGREPNSLQNRWLKDAANYMGDVKIASGMDAKARVMEKDKNNATREFVKRLFEGEAS